MFKTPTATMSHRQADQDAQEASAPTQGGPHLPPPRGPPGTGNEAGSDDGGKRLRPNLITNTYIPKRASRGILVDYPDSPGSDSNSPVPDQASPEGRPGSGWPNQTPEKSGTNESDPDFLEKVEGSGSKLGAGRGRAQDLDSGFKSMKSRSFGSPCTSPDMFHDSSLDPERVGVDSGSDSDMIPASQPQTPPPSRIPILRLPRPSTSSLSNQEDSQIVGRKRKGGQVALSSSSGSASESDLSMEGGYGAENPGNSDSDPGRARKLGSGGIGGAKTKPEAKPKGKGKPSLSPLDFTSDSLNDFKIPKRKGKMTKVEIRQISILKNFENKNKLNYKSPKNPNPKPGRGRGSGRGGLVGPDPAQLGPASRTTVSPTWKWLKMDLVMVPKQQATNKPKNYPLGSHRGQQGVISPPFHQ